jgi:uncharacterized protein YbbK (DUF523 family)
MPSSRQKTILVSSCLLGLRTRFDGGGKWRPELQGLLERYQLVPVCPEQLGGLPTPRPPAEIQGGSGDAVLDDESRVLTVEGADVTANFVRGAEECLAAARLFGAEGALFKARSPSCASGQSYDGSFGGRLVPGFGVAAALLRRNGLRILSEEDLSAGRDF